MSNVVEPSVQVTQSGSLSFRGKKRLAYRLSGPHDDDKDGVPDVRLSLYVWPLGQVLDHQHIELEPTRLVDAFDQALELLEPLLPAPLKTVSDMLQDLLPGKGEDRPQ